MRRELGAALTRLSDKYAMPMTLTAVFTPDPEGGYVAFNPETGSTTQEQIVTEALDNLREATELYLEEFPVESCGRPLLTTFEIAHA